MNRQGGMMASLKWLDFSNHILNIQKNLFLSETYFDVILKMDKKELKCHRCILSAASTFFETIFQNLTDEIVTVIIPDVEYNILLSILTFIYTGECNINPNGLSQFLEASSLLKIKGLISYGGNVNGIYIEGAQIFDSDSLIMEEKVEDEEIAEETENIEYLEDSEFSQLIEDLGDEDNSRIDSHDEEMLKDENSYLSASDSICYENVEQNESSESVNMEISSTSKRTVKQYDETSITDALNEIKTGQTLKNIAAKYNIPRSTLYMKSKQFSIETGNDFKKSKYKHIEQAVNAIVNKELSFHQAEMKYKVPKSVLWRRVQKCSNYKSGKRVVSAVKTAAIEAIQNGESLSKFPVPPQLFDFQFLPELSL